MITLTLTLPPIPWKSPPSLTPPPRRCSPEINARIQARHPETQEQRDARLAQARATWDKDVMPSLLKQFLAKVEEAEPGMRWYDRDFQQLETTRFILDAEAHQSSTDVSPAYALEWTEKALVAHFRAARVPWRVVLSERHYPFNWDCALFARYGVQGLFVYQT